MFKPLTDFYFSRTFNYADTFQANIILGCPFSLFQANILSLVLVSFVELNFMLCETMAN
jgi:hypothetical protein